MVDIYYDLFDANDDLCTVSVLLSSDNGSTFTDFPNPDNLIGDLGPEIANGIGKHIVWNAGADGVAYDTDTYRIRIVADDDFIPIIENFVYVPGGTFLMGDTRGAGYPEELPVHSVTLSPFYIGKYEVTQAEYAAILGSIPSDQGGVGDINPVYFVPWYSVLKYCNLKSMAESLAPCYTINGSTDPANWGPVPTDYNTSWDAVICNWSANGYRLPTEAEWEYAARGATNNPDYLYAGSDDINAVAWWYGNNTPNGSKPVGTKAPNGIGAFDMSGNVWEWCWDWYGSYSYSTQNNPVGPSSGSYRLLRGDGWNMPSSSYLSRRLGARPLGNFVLNGAPCFGFRLCRSIN